MNILSIDSSGNMLSLVLKKNSQFYSYLDSQQSRASQIILSSIDKIMSDNNLDVSDLNLIIFNKGPASFTGTRIAASVCQAIGYSLNIPVIGVNSLSLMAYKYNCETSYPKITCIKKAYGDKYYLGQFVSLQEGGKLISEEYDYIFRIRTDLKTNIETILEISY